MRRIIHKVKIYFAINPDESIMIDGLADRGAPIMAIPAAADMLGHRIVPVKYFDMK